MAPSTNHVLQLLEHAAEAADRSKGVIVYTLQSSEFTPTSQYHDLAFGTSFDSKSHTHPKPALPSVNAWYQDRDYSWNASSPVDKENAAPRRDEAAATSLFPVQHGGRIDFGPDAVGSRYVPVPIGFNYTSRYTPATPKTSLINLEVGSKGSVPCFICYKTLLEQAKIRSKAVNGLMAHQGNKIVLLHTECHLQGIVWFWAIITAGGIPCLSTQLSLNPETRKKQLENLNNKLQRPSMITNRRGRDEIPEYGHARIIIEEFEEFGTNREFYEDKAYNDAYRQKQRERLVSKDLALLMLTSGSTGAAKAVRLTHEQIVIAIRAKTWMHKKNSLGEDDVFLSWTGLDHVANLMEIHLHAMAKNCMQIHVPSSPILEDPFHFLDLIHTHRVSYTFAPNFFLAQLIATRSKDLAAVHQKVNEGTEIAKEEEEYLPAVHESMSPQLISTGDLMRAPLNLSSLRCLISGGEANPLNTIHALTEMLQGYRAEPPFIIPAFGMTETCAGSIYNLRCPDYDDAYISEFANLGSPIDGLNVRIYGKLAQGPHGEGEVQLMGPVVFDGYYNDHEASQACMTPDGWFRTGDWGFVDVEDRLHITGRIADAVIINGINHHLNTIEAALAESKIDGITPTSIVVFGYRPEDCETEKLVVIYLPTFAEDDSKARHDTAMAISNVVITTCNVHPYLTLPIPEQYLTKTTIGKISRAKLKKHLTNGDFREYIDNNHTQCSQHKRNIFARPQTGMEIEIITTYKAIFDDFTIHQMRIGRTDNLFSHGFSSIDLLKLKRKLQDQIFVPNIPVTVFFANPTVKELAPVLEKMVKQQFEAAQAQAALEEQQALDHASEKEQPAGPESTPLPPDIPATIATYDPIVTLQPNGTQTPLFLIHSGIGDILIFLPLSRLLPNRPIHALRARGFDGDPFFTSMAEITHTYLHAIRRIQPCGPYAILGYSFGSIIAFEIAKILESEREEVKFLGTIDQPPHFKERAASYDYLECILTLTLILGLITTVNAYDAVYRVRTLSPPSEKLHSSILDVIMERVPETKMEELGLDRERLDRWAKLALGLKQVGGVYDPTGRVKGMDVFFCEPLVGLVQARNLQEWFDGFISKWGEFVEPETEGEGFGSDEEMEMGEKKSIGGIRFHDVGGGHRTLISIPHVKRFSEVLIRAMAERGV